MQVITFVAGVALGALAGFWYTVWARRPKLRLEGQEGNPGVPGGPWRVFLSIKLAPVRMGLQIGESRFLGRRLHGSHYWGISTTREMARNCHAVIRKADSKTQGLGLRWVGDDGLIHNEGNPVNIGPDDRYRLGLIGGDTGTGSFHVLTDGPEHTLRLADQAFTESQKFVVTLLQEGGPKTHLKVRITRQFNGTWDVRAAHRWRNTRVRD